MNYFVYILRCADDTFYIGITNDLVKRLSAHNDGVGAKYTRGRLPVRYMYTEECEGKGVALKREIVLKGLSRTQKMLLIEKAL